MKTCNFVKMLTACMLSFLFLSCGDDIVYETIKNTDEGLCDKTWIMQTEQDGAVVRQYKLTFYSKNQKGQELTKTKTVKRDEAKLFSSVPFSKGITDMDCSIDRCPYYCCIQFAGLCTAI